MQQLGGDEISRLGRSIGAEPAATQRAVDAALPMLFGALATNSSRPQGAASLASALDRDHDGSILDDLAGFLGGGDSGPGDGILRHVLGGRKTAAEAQLGQASGLDPGRAGQLLAMLAPLVLGALGRAQKRRGFDPADLAGMLQTERDRAARIAPEGLGGLARWLDADGDGDVLDDAARLGSDLLGGLFKGR
jgi:hypothetical protein